MSERFLRNEFEFDSPRRPSDLHSPTNSSVSSISINNEYIHSNKRRKCGRCSTEDWLETPKPSTSQQFQDVKIIIIMMSNHVVVSASQ
jgi:hypothetical protein